MYYHEALQALTAHVMGVAISEIDEGVKEELEEEVRRASAFDRSGRRVRFELARHLICARLPGPLQVQSIKQERLRRVQEKLAKGGQ